MADRREGRYRGLRRWTLLAGALLAIVVLVGGGLAIYAARALSRFEQVEARRSTVLYAAAPVLRPGVNVNALDLAGILGRQGYRETRAAGAPGQFSRSENAWEINVAGAARVTLAVSGGRVTQLRQGNAAVQSVALPPELLASAGADMGENIRPVRLPDVPQALRDAVLVTEDARFYEHGGVDPRGIVRALWTNVRRRPRRRGGQHHHPAARQEPAAQPGAYARPQDQRGAAVDRPRVALQQRSDPRGLPQRDLSGAIGWLGGAGRRRGLRGVLRQGGPSALADRSRAARGNDPRPQQRTRRSAIRSGRGSGATWC